MKTIHIRYPIWKTRSVGIAESKIVDDIKVYIDYKTIDGKKLYPGYYFIEKEKALEFPYQYWKNVKLRIIPITAMELRGRIPKKDPVVEIIKKEIEQPLQKNLFAVDK